MNYSVENFAGYTLPQLVLWFNARPEANRTMPMVFNLFKVKLLEVEGTAQVIVNSNAPEGSIYIGESVFLYTGVPSNAPITVKAEDFFEISKVVMPQGEHVSNALTHFAEELERENG